MSASDVAAGITRIAASGALANASMELEREALEEAELGASEIALGATLEESAQRGRQVTVADARVDAAKIGAGVSARA